LRLRAKRRAVAGPGLETATRQPGQPCEPFGSAGKATRTNGKAERFIQMALREWAYAASYAPSNERANELPRWLHEYNFYRNHSALQNKPPISRIETGVNNVLQLHTWPWPRRLLGRG